MGLVYAEVESANGSDMYLFRQGLLGEEKIKQVTINALVDSGAYMLCINENVKAQLDLLLIEKQFSRLADETLLELEVVGPVEFVLKIVRRRFAQSFCPEIRKFCSARFR